MTILVPNYKQASILVVGDIILDRYWYGNVNKISPEAPVPIISISSTENRPGGAANVAMNIASLGAHSYLIGLIGKDDNAEILKKNLNCVNIHSKLITTPNHKTINKIRVLSKNQQLIRIDFEENFNKVNTKQIINNIKQILPNIKALVLSDYSKGTLNDIDKIITLANKTGIPVLIDPKKNNFESYKGATLLTPNLTEFETIVGPCKNNKDTEKKGTELLKHLKLTGLLITRSEQGMSLISQNKPPIHFQSKAKKVFDVTGAGDTVIAVLAASIASGSSMHDACVLANTAAGIVVGKIGTSTVSKIELKNTIYKHKKKYFWYFNKKSIKKSS